MCGTTVTYSPEPALSLLLSKEGSTAPSIQRLLEHRRVFVAVLEVRNRA